MEIGSIYLKEQNHQEAEKFLLTVMNNYPDAEQENQLAIELMMEVYNLRGNLTGYYDWLSSRGIDVSVQEKDSTLWRSVVLARDNGDCNTQIEKASYYLDNIEEPIREISAHYFMANCYYAEDKKKHKHYFIMIILRQNQIITIIVEALKYAGEITYDAKDFKVTYLLFSFRRCKY